MTYQENLNQLEKSLTDFLNRKPAPIIKRAFTRETRGGGTEQVYEMICNGCGKEFESNRSHKLWHDNGCTKRASRVKGNVKKLLQAVIEDIDKTKLSQNDDQTE